jgi:integrase
MKARVKQQRGQIFKHGKSWFGRWRRNEIVHAKDLTPTERQRFDKLGLSPDGTIAVRRQHAEKLADVCDAYRTAKDVRPLLEEKLRPVNEGRCSPESTLSVARYGDDHFLPFAEKELKPSTAHGYKSLWQMYLRPRLTEISVRDFRCVDATQILADIHQHHRIGRVTLRHCKALISVVFSHAKRNGVIDGSNPATDAGIPRAAETSKPTHATTAQEVLEMLGALDGIARTAVALIFFAGLRPGEARASRWEHFDGKTLRILSSRWGKFTTAPKTPESVAPVPVCETLRAILAETRRESGYILPAPGRKPNSDEAPIDLHNLAARTVVPALSRCGVCKEEKDDHGESDHEFKPLPQWHGWYALRRGLATLATSIDSQLAAKSLLRHSNVHTTQAYYIKSVPDDALRAVATIDQLFQKTAGTALN